MLRLRVLGGLSLERDGQPLTHAAARRHQLALLALVVSYHEQGISGDKIVAYLWPDCDTLHARNSLKQVLFTLRQLLGPEVLPPRRPVLRLDSAAIGADVWEFEAALARGDDVGAAAAYGGPYLDGFYLDGLGDFERWVEAERERLAASHADALRRLAGRVEGTGDVIAAVGWWRRLAAVDPFGSVTAVSLMRALAASGDPIGALEYAREYAARMSAELNLPGDPAVTALSEQLRREIGRRRMSVPMPSRPLSLQAFNPGRRSSDVVSAATPWPPASRVRGLRVPVRSAALAVLGLTLAGITGGLVGRHRATAPARVTDPATVVVLPFAVSGDREVRELGAGVEDLLAASLDGADGLRSVPLVTRSRQTQDRSGPIDLEAASAMASRAGARLYVTGRVVRHGGHLRAVTVLYDRGNANTPVGHAEAEAEGTSGVFELVDELAKQLIADRYRGPDRRLTRTAVASTRSLTALKAYLEGERQLRAGRYPAASDAFQLAVLADTAFALASYRLSMAADWAGRANLALRAAERAARFGAQLSDHDRRLVEAYSVHHRGRLADAERLYRGIVADYPEDVESWFELGQLLFHGNPLRGRSSHEARPAFERVLALDPQNGQALVYLARIASAEGDLRKVDSLIRRAVTITSDSAVLDVRGFRTFALNDRPGQVQATRDLLIHPMRVPATTALQVAAYNDDLTDAERFAQLLIADGGSCETRVLGHRMLAEASLARGRLHTARNDLTQAEACDRGAAVELRALFAALPFVPADGEELARVRRTLENEPDTGVQPGVGGPVEMERPVRLYCLGLIATRRGETEQGRRSEKMLVELSDSTLGGDLAWSLAASLRARAALAAGRQSAALAALESARWERAAALSVVEAADRYLRADLLRELGREEEAIGWYRAIAERASYELVYLAPAQYRLAQIYDHRGERAEAAMRYRRFLELWQDPDPELSPVVADAKQRLATLDERAAR